jgi:glycosyltransferase involved in cell wall biosynthesis
MNRILAVLPDHPHPPDMGSRVRNLRILEALAARFDLTIVTHVHDRARLDDPGPVASLGRWVPVLASHRRGLVPKAMWHVRARWSAAVEGLHRETFFQSLPGLSRAVEGLLDEVRPALVHAAYWYTLRHLEPFPRPPVWVVDTHDVQFQRHERLWDRRSEREKRREIAELKRYDRVIAITEEDRGTFERHLDGSPACEVIGMGVDLAQWDPESLPPELPDAPRVAFYGNLANESNQIGAEQLVRELAPALRGEVPDLEILILGADPPPRIRSLAVSVPGTRSRDGGAASGPDRPLPVRVTGFVADVRPWLLSSRVLALSLKTGSGQRGRVIESLALGVPVVGYAEALEGLRLSDGEGIRVARSPEEFRQRLVELLRHPEEARCLGAAGRACVGERYSLEATYQRFPALYQRLLSAD